MRWFFTTFEIFCNLLRKT